MDSSCTIPDLLGFLFLEPRERENSTYLVVSQELRDCSPVRCWSAAGISLRCRVGHLAGRVSRRTRAASGDDLLGPQATRQVLGRPLSPR